MIHLNTLPPQAQDKLLSILHLSRVLFLCTVALSQSELSVWLHHPLVFPSRCRGNSAVAWRQSPCQRNESERELVVLALTVDCCISTDCLRSASLWSTRACFPWSGDAACYLSLLYGVFFRANENSSLFMLLLQLPEATSWEGSTLQWQQVRKTNPAEQLFCDKAQQGVFSGLGSGNVFPIYFLNEEL